MANIKSQIKRNRQNERLRARNRALRSELKTRARTAVEAAQAGDTAGAEEALRAAQQRIDTAAAKGVLPRNTAARRKSRLTKQVRSLLG
jgi:small subunit ribosomal protein S20